MRKIFLLLLTIVILIIPRVSEAYDITQISGFNERELESLVTGTGLEGTGYAFYQMERKYSVNAIFAISIAQIESGHGTSDMARYDNNIFGMMGCYYNSISECINDFGDLMRYEYFDRGLNDLWSVGSVYCPDNNNWSELIESQIYYNLNYLNR